MAEDLHELLRREMTARESELIELHRALVRIPTINRGDGSSADEDKLAAFGARWLSEATGGAARCEQAAGAPGRGNLLAETGPAETSDPQARTMLWMSHADVVPAGDESAWTHPPFSAELEGGRIWGRGSNDCKMLVAAQMFAQATMARLGLPRRGRLRLAVGADEEVGGRWGFGWLAEARADFLRADLAICEGGGGTLGRFGGEHPIVSVGTGEKGRYDVIFTIKGEGGHASTPWGKFNPLLTAAELARRVADWQAPAAPASPIFPHLGLWVGLEGGVTPENLEEAIARMGRHSAALANSLRAQSRLALTPTVVAAGDKANAIPTEARLTCDARLLPGQGKADLEAIVAELLEGIEHVDVRIETTTAPSVSEFDDTLAAMFRRATERAVGGAAEIVPTWCSGATDARYVRSVGTPVYGFQLIHPGADPDRLSIHCVDESIEAGMLLPCALSLAHLALEYLDEVELH